LSLTQILGKRGRFEIASEYKSKSNSTVPCGFRQQNLKNTSWFHNSREEQRLKFNPELVQGKTVKHNQNRKPTPK